MDTPLAFDPSKGYPAGDSIQYECLACGDRLPSMPKQSLACRCRNIVVDVDAGRVAIRDKNNFKAYSLD